MDQTNGGVPSAGGQMSGEASREAAIKRLKRLQEQGALKRDGFVPTNPQIPTGLKG